MENDIRCVHCNKKFSEVIKGDIQIIASSNFVLDPDKEVKYIEEVRCPRCKKNTIKFKE